MSIALHTPRLHMREPDLDDVDDFFEMDSDPLVHQYVGGQPLQTRDEVRRIIARLQEQHRQNGTARLAVVVRETGECIGWCGLRVYPDEVRGLVGFLELGYRFKRRHWGKGYATEASLAVVEDGFARFPVEALYAVTHPQHTASGQVLRKLGFVLSGTVDLDDGPNHWFVLGREAWEARPQA